MQQKDDPTYWNELRRIEADYERRRYHRVQYFEAVKQAESIDVDDIPLPDMMPPEPGSVQDIPLPQAEPSVGILKKSATMLGPIPPPNPTFEGRNPPGVPVGPLPSLSDMEDESEEETETHVASKDPKSVRFEGEDKNNEERDALSEMDKFMKEVRLLFTFL